MRPADIILGAALALTFLPYAVVAESAAAATPHAAKAGGFPQDGLLGGLSLSSDRGPVTIEAKELEFDYRTQTLTYRGEVMVTQGDLTLRSERLRVLLNEEGVGSQRVREVVAEGEVKIGMGERTASGGRAVFDQQAKTVTLSERAVLRDGPNEVTGERVVVYLDERRSIVEGGGAPVRAVLFPPTAAADTAGGKAGEKMAAEPRMEQASGAERE